MRVKSNLKMLLDQRNISIRKFAEISGLHFETLRRLYNDETKQFQRDSIGRICEVLDIKIDELLILEKEKEEPSHK